MGLTIMESVVTLCLMKQKYTHIKGMKDIASATLIRNILITNITDGISANVFICSIMSIAATYVHGNYDLLSFHLYHQSVSYNKF